MKGTDLSACIHIGRERRVTLNRDAVVTESDGCSIEVVVVDMTQHNFRLRSVAELEVGSTVKLQMGDSRPVAAEIRWACGHEAGGVFLDPITI